LPYASQFEEDTHMPNGHTEPAIDRKFALQLLGTIGGAVALGKCSGGVLDVASASVAATATAGSSACAETPEGEIGPYFADDGASGFDRSNIVANLDGSGAEPGIPLTLSVTIVDTEKSCVTVSGAQVDIWHCNAAGVYSDESSEGTTADTWLRGYQTTGSTGIVTFTTVFPGWYEGRTTHIHLRVRSSYSEASSTSDGMNTTQLFFPQATIDEIDGGVAPYSSHGRNDTTNATDHVYADETAGANVLTLAGSSSTGFRTSITIGLPIG
jgi:protocatechuate 3,4-dioxygenase beta subunit